MNFVWPEFQRAQNLNLSLVLVASFLTTFDDFWGRLEDEVEMFQSVIFKQITFEKCKLD